MAVSTTFKQQCPSCEAMVPVKDRKLVGKKIDCPKCRYRFVVEAPVEEEEAPSKNGKKSKGKSDQITSKPKSGPPAKGKKDGAKAKAGPRKGDDDEDEDEDEEDTPRRKSKAANNKTKLILGVSLAGVAVMLLGLTAVLFMGSGEGGSRTASTRTSSSTLPKDTDKPVIPKDPSTEANFADITNLLPNDADVVIHVNVKELVASRLGQLLFETPGGFRQDAVSKQVGIPVIDMDRLVMAGNLTQDWTFLALRTNRPVNQAEVSKTWRLKKAGNPIQGQDYFLAETRGPADNLASVINASNPQSGPGKPKKPSSDHVEVRFVDDQTVVVADPVPMRQFLQANGRPTLKSQPGAVTPPAGGGGHGGMDPMAPPMDPMTPPMTPMTPPPVPSSFVGSPSYLTIDPALKAVLDRVETKQPVILSGAANLVEAQKLSDFKQQWNQMSLGLIAAGVGSLGPPNAVGFGLHMKDTLVCPSVSVDLKTEADAKNVQDALRKLVTTALPPAAQVFVKLDLIEGDGPAPTPTTPVPPDGTTPPMPDPAQPMPTPTPMPMPTPTPIPGGFPLTAPIRALIRLTGQERLVAVSAEVTVPAELQELAIKQLQPAVVAAKGEFDMSSGQPRMHELGDAASKYSRHPQRMRFPRGAADRPLDTTRAGRPWPPDQRISWMAELLPFLGHDEVYNRLQLRKSWKDIDNARVGYALIPAFLDPKSDRLTWRTRVPSLPNSEFGATHYVGMAGIGLDAAEYSLSDPDQAKKIGIIGYDREATLADVVDGLSNTILMVRVPPSFKRPWIAGGGATVQGVPETKSIEPFVSTTLGGKKGTFVLMADGSVRFVTADISDAAFKALCTMKGGESVSGKETMAVKPEDELKAQPLAGFGRRDRLPDEPNSPPPITPDPPVVTPPPVPGGGNEGEGEWKDFVSNSGRFSVKFPGKPTESTRTVRLANIGSVAQTLFTLDSKKEEAIFVLGYFDVQPVALTQGPALLLDAVHKEIAVASGATKQITEGPINLGNFVGKEVHFETNRKMGNEPIVVKCKIYVVNRRVYHQTVTGPGLRAFGIPGDIFFGDFKVVPR